MLLTVMAVLDWRFLEASVVTRELAVKVASCRLPKASTLIKDEPEEDAISKIGLVVVAIFCKDSKARGATVPIPTLAVAVTYKATVEEAVTLKGFKALLLAVVMLTKVPVPVLLVVSLKVKRFLSAVSLPHVKVEVVLAMDRAKLAVGLERADQDEPVPVPQAWSVVLQRILTVAPSTTLNLPAVES